MTRFAQRIRFEMAGRRTTLYVFLLYCLLTIVMTWPVAANMRENIPGSEGDALVHLWTFRWVRQSLFTGQNVFHTPLLFYPDGASLVFHNFAWMHIAAWIPLQFLVREAAAYSIVFLILFPLNGIAVYLLARDITGSHWAAFVGGLVASFWPYILSHHNHPNLILIAWVPLALRYLRRLLKYGRLRDAGLTALCLALTGISRWQLLVIGGFLLGFFTIYHFVADRSIRLRRKIVLLILVGLLSGLIMAPLLSPVLIAQISRDDPESLFVTERPIQTDLLAYVLPSRYHPFWGEAVFGWYQNIRDNTVFTPFIGYTALGLTIIGLRRRWREARFWLWAALLYILLALGNQLHFNGSASVTLPLAWIEDSFIIRLVRHSDRFNVMLSVPVAILVAFGIQALNIANKVPHKPGLSPPLASRPIDLKRHQILVGLLVFFILIEYIVSYPIYPLTVPNWYQQVAEMPGQFGVLDIPMGSRSYDKEYMMYQFVHAKPLVGGHVSRPTADAYAFINTVPLLQSLQEQPGAPSSLSNVSHQLQLLRRADVRFVVLHKKFLTDGQVAAWKQWLILPPLHEDDQVLVYDTRTAVAGRDFKLELRPSGEGANESSFGIIQTAIQPLRVVGGDWIFIDLDWGSEAAITRDHTICLNLSNLQETITTQCEALTPDWPTSRWQANELIHRRHAVWVDPFWPAGDYTVSVSVQADEGHINGQHIPIGSVYLDNRLRQFTPPQPAHQTAVAWQDAIHLVGYDIEIADPLQLTLYWQAQRRMAQSYKVFVHLLDANNGQLIAQVDFIPQQWTYPTNWWEQGEYITDTVQLPLDDVAAGTYDITIGLYDSDTGQRLMATAVNGPNYPDGVVPLTTIQHR